MAGRGSGRVLRAAPVGIGPIASASWLAPLVDAVGMDSVAGTTRVPSTVSVDDDTGLPGILGLGALPAARATQSSTRFGRLPCCDPAQPAPRPLQSVDSATITRCRCRVEDAPGRSVSLTDPWQRQACSPVPENRVFAWFGLELPRCRSDRKEYTGYPDCTH